MVKKILILSCLWFLAGCTSSDEEASKGVDFYDSNINNVASSVNMGNVISTRTIILKNKSDSQTVAQFTMTKGLGFEVTNNCGTGNIQIPSNGSCNVLIHFNPENVVGVQKVRLTFGSKSIEITATGVGECQEDHHFDSSSSSCVSNSRICSVSNGTGNQSYVNGLWGPCQMTSCNNGFESIQDRCRPICGVGYHRDVPPPGYVPDPERDAELGIESPNYTYNCVNNVIACESMPDNALQAVRNWDTSTLSYGACTITACIFKYHLDVTNNVCVYNVQDCEGDNGATGFQQWQSNNWGACTINACPTGLHIENNQCVDNERACVDQSGGIGKETWDQVSWGSCVLDSCLLDGFHVEDNLCKPNFRACSLQELSAIPFAVAGKSTWISGKTYHCEIFACSGMNMVAFQNQCVDKTTAPPMVNDFIINNGKAYTNSLTVGLLLGLDPVSMVAPVQMKITNNADCSGGTYEAFSYDKNWTLLNSNVANQISVMYRDANNHYSACITKSIIHDGIPPSPVLDMDFTSTYMFGNNVILNMATVDKLRKPYVFNSSQLPDGFRWYMGARTDENLDKIQIAIGSGMTGSSINDTMDWKNLQYSSQPFSGGYSPAFQQVFINNGTIITSPSFLFDRSYYISIRLLDLAGNISPVYTSRFSYQIIDNYFKVSCNAILQADPTLAGKDGVYMIDPDGSFLPTEPRAVYCDMTTDGGGWTKIDHDLGYKYPGSFTRTSYSKDGSYLNARCPEGTIYAPTGGRYYTSTNYCSGSRLWPAFSANNLRTGGDAETSRSLLCSYYSGFFSPNTYPDPDPLNVKDGYLTYSCQSGSAPFNGRVYEFNNEDRGCHNAPLVSQENYNHWACEGGSYNCTTFCYHGVCSPNYSANRYIDGFQTVVDMVHPGKWYVTGVEWGTGDIRGGCRGAYVYGMRVYLAPKTDPWLVLNDQSLIYNEVWINARGSSNYASLDPYASTAWKVDGWSAHRHIVQIGSGGLNDQSNKWYFSGSGVNFGTAIAPIDANSSSYGGPYIRSRWGSVGDCRENGTQYGSNAHYCAQNIIYNTRGQRIKRVSDIENLNRQNWQDNSSDLILNIYVR